MNRSSKFNFFLPQNTDPIEVSDFNSNFETIDANLLTKAQNLTETQKNAVRANVDLNVANNLTTTAAGSVLDARQGKVLGDSVSSLHQKYFSLDTAPDIPNNSNFNSLTTPGCYRVRSYSSATTMTNIPEFTAGVLYVKNSMLEHGSAYRQQIYHTHQNKIYMRMSSDSGSTWTSWEEFVTKSQFVTETVTVDNSEQIPANTVKPIVINIAKTGYTPVGIMSVTGTGTTGLLLQEFYISSNNAMIYFRNVTSSTMSPTKFRLSILYSKN